MQIADGKAVLIHYKVANAAGEVVDSSEGDEPLAYIHGQGDIVAGLESALVGKAAGSRVQVVVTPADGYGEREAGKVQKVPRSAFEEESNLEPGMQFHAETDDGTGVMVTVTHVDDDEVTVDANHPLAGETLHFDVEVVSVRDCTEEEREHGHIHGPGGHHHH